jgi:hypothetical protein
MDRAGYVRGQDGYFLVQFGEQVRVEELEIPAPATVSIQGVFTGKYEVRVTRLHVHTSELRDYPSYLGLVLIATIWGTAFWKRHRTRQ